MIMRGLTRRWVLRQTEGAPLSNGATTLNLPSLAMRVLAARGLIDDVAIRRFCDPKLTDLHDPGLLPNIDRAATRIIDAVRSDQLIAVYGDYDVDGITATAILYHTIKTAQPSA